jgi:small subunit ribosomal protein S21
VSSALTIDLEFTDSLSASLRRREAILAIPPGDSVKNVQRSELELGPLEVKVDGSVDRALGRLKRALAREGVLKEVKNRRFYEKPSVKDKRKRREAERRRRRALRAPSPR